MKHHMQLRNRTPLVKPQEPKKDVSNANNKTNKLLSSLKELFGVRLYLVITLINSSFIFRITQELRFMNKQRNTK